MKIHKLQFLNNIKHYTTSYYYLPAEADPKTVGILGDVLTSNTPSLCPS